ncbi:hypothetical protein NX059_009853 [Plenodomus lindquistii]|nr:hypothetical protein NX059_009853 [Plenodomus lindquistii]
MDNQEMNHDPISNVRDHRLIIAIDFGTTFSSVAYAVLPRGVRPETVLHTQVQCIKNYPGYEPVPGTRPDFREDVPTELWYDDDRTGSWRQRLVNPYNEDTRITAKQYWGYEVWKTLSDMNVPRDEARPLTRIKLNLVPQSDTRFIQSELNLTLKALMASGIINEDTDIYKHFLTHLLNHTKEQLQSSNELQEDTVIEFVLCVPAKWPAAACRDLQSALEGAVKDVSLNKNAEHNVCDLFMISEPEAAAEYILTEAKIELYSNETVVILDAGGGTVDAVTYRCENGDPVRLAEEVIDPDSQLCGASYINERFEEELLDMLANEEYLVDDVHNSMTLESIAQSKTTMFENYEKRIRDVTRPRQDSYRVRIEYLKGNPDPSKGLFPNVLELPGCQMRNFFEPSLIGAREVLEKQLDLAEEKGLRVEKVILTGGFGESPSLRSYLRNYLQDRPGIEGRSIDLVVPQNTSTAVAKGAVLRALNKEYGPKRFTQCSYGFIVKEPYQPESIPAHKGHKRKRLLIDPTDGERYVEDTIRWVLQAGEKVKHMQEFSLRVKQTFDSREAKLLSNEELLISDSKHENYYTRRSPRNNGAGTLGRLEADFTQLMAKRRVQPQPNSSFGKQRSQKYHYEIWYDVVLIVNGRTMRFEARYPAKDDLGPGEKQEVLGMKLVGSMAASFKPGTA